MLVSNIKTVFIYRYARRPLYEYRTESDASSIDGDDAVSHETSKDESMTRRKESKGSSSEEKQKQKQKTETKRRPTAAEAMSTLAASPPNREFLMSSPADLADGQPLDSPHYSR